MYRTFRYIPIFKDFPLICPYFLDFRVGRYAIVIRELMISVFNFFSP